ncbi:MAG: acyl-CoA dehydratase activase [Clostridiales bacterium]|jgi:predicted CoA-substrate-specific enzyme activase|nr:acyl-CoA dehydratase activase [Clostridiales bacterium]
MDNQAASTVNYLGIDVGSTGIKIVCVDDDANALWRQSFPTNPLNIKLVEKQDFMKSIGVEIAAACSTGYGRKKIGWADCAATEILCQAKGVSALDRNCKTVIDIGGQDTKIISVENSQLARFSMNDKCAAGTGRFIEKAAGILGCSLEEMSKSPICEKGVLSIDSTCATFAETEIISLIAEGKDVSRIINSLYHSLAGRIANMVRTFGLTDHIVLTGGLATHGNLVYWLEQLLECHITIPDEPRFSAAYGAAIIGGDFIRRKLRQCE